MWFLIERKVQYAEKGIFIPLKTACLNSKKTFLSHFRFNMIFEV